MGGFPRVLQLEECTAAEGLEGRGWSDGGRGGGKASAEAARSKQWVLQSAAEFQQRMVKMGHSVSTHFSTSFGSDS
eukprot:1196431-Prorocentrum_minimum.AAC.3